MKISFVVAASNNGVIGLHNQLPWHLPEDLKFFKKTTLGHPIIMGRNTFLSFGKALPGRTNIILSRTLTTPPVGTLVYHSMEDILVYLQNQKVDQAYIIGGGEIFKEYRNLANELFLTRVHTQIQHGEVFFELPTPEKWQLVWSEAHFKDEKHAFDFTFERWIRK